MANQTHIPDAPNSILYRALRSAKADEMLSYNAIDEVRDMAGDNIRAEIATACGRRSMASSQPWNPRSADCVGPSASPSALLPCSWAP